MMLWIILGAITVFLFIIIVVLKISSQVNAQFNHINESLQKANEIIGHNLSNTTNVFGNVREQLGKLEATNTQVLEVSKNISSLQELLRAPKFRGQLGEMFLENLLAQVLPKACYKPQYRFKSGETVDAIITLGERLVPIDAKFSLENFKKLLEAPEEQEQNGYRKKFIQDVKLRIEEIATKYILPQENTYDFALMYIPAENVYYEIITTPDILSYGAAKKVFPVSPNTLYSYLQVICLGLKGLKIEENAKEILKNLGMLFNEIAKFREEFSLLGVHLVNASHKYEDSQKKLERLSERLKNIQDTRETES